MFNKKKCRTCKYSMNIGGRREEEGNLKRGEVGVMCGRALILNESNLKLIDGEVVDMRGDDGAHCGCYSPKKKQGMGGCIDETDTVG